MSWRAAWAALGLLVGVMPSWADAEILNLRLPLFVKETKIAVMGHTNATVCKAPSQNGESVSFCHGLIHKIILGFNVEVITASESPTDWIDDTSAAPFFHLSTSIKVIRKSFFYSAVGLFFYRCREQIRKITESERRFSASILILNRNLDGLTDSRFRPKSSICGSNPRSLRADNCLGGRFGLFGHSFSLFLGGDSGLAGSLGRFLSRISLQFYRSIDLNHFMDLPAHGNEGHGNQDNGSPFTKFLSAILALFLFAVGNAFLLYGVDKSREIGGWAVWIVFAGFPFFLAASIFFFNGVLGWDGGLSAWGL